MLLNLQAVRPEIRQRLKTACMAVAGLTALYLSIQPLRQAKEVSKSRDDRAGRGKGGDAS